MQRVVIPFAILAAYPYKLKPVSYHRANNLASSYNFRVRRVYAILETPRYNIDLLYIHTERNEMVYL